MVLSDSAVQVKNADRNPGADEAEQQEAPALGRARVFQPSHITTGYNCPMPFVLSLDEGTTSARAALYDEQGRNAAMESAPVRCRYPRAGWVEQDADEIWNAQLYAARLLLDRSGTPAA